MEFRESTLTINQIQIKNADDSSYFNTGQNLYKRVHILGKTNEGFGQQCADQCIILSPRSEIFDQDMIDAVVEKNTWKGLF